MDLMLWAPVDRRRKSLRVLGCSTLAVAAAMASPTQAACSPNPPQNNGTTTCTGRTDGGLVASTSSTVNVVAGAVLAGGAGTPAFTATAGISYPYSSIIALNIDGRVDGAGAAGVLLTNGAAGASAYPSTLLNLKVGSAGVVEGATGIVLRPTSGNQYGRATATLDNSGIVRATAGAAIVASNSESTGFITLTNRAGGFIGGIDATVQSLDNAGTIDGGTGSAYRYSVPAGSSFAAYPSSLTNSGVMRSNGTADTIALPSSVLTITNRGTIANTGTGSAINSGSAINIANNAGATISSAGGVAIRAANSLTLTNRGTINGSVVANGFSTIDTVGGAIRGDVLLGAGNDRVVGTLDAATSRFAEISGRVDGGGGTNTAELRVAADTSLDGFVAPTNFQLIQFDLANAALSLNRNATYSIALAGTGRFTNNGAIVTTGPAFTTAYIPPQAIDFRNGGTITATLAQATNYAVQLSSLSGFANSGAINGVGGGGVLANMSNRGSVSNGGVITASGTALSSSGGPVTNSGTIRSTGGVGADISLGGGLIRSVTSTNSGLIEGSTIGLRLQSVTFVNSGTIRGVNGVGVEPIFDSTIVNSAGGVISGAVSGIGFATNYGYAAIVRNAGRIEGNVNFLPPGTSSATTAANTYVDEGGTIAGNLLLGNSGTLVTDLSRMANGRFAGATGTVDPGTNGTLRLRIPTTTTVALPTFASFASLGFDLSNDAALTLTADRGPLDMAVQLSGTGSVDLNANLATVNRSVITVGGGTVDDLINAAPYPSRSAVSVISRGALSFRRTQSSAAYIGVPVLPGSTFENAGSLTVTAGPNVASTVAIYGDQYGSFDSKVINSGTITLANGVTGVQQIGSLVNSGRIVDAPISGAANIGVANLFELRNSGTISVSGIAVRLDSNAYEMLIDNGGTIASSGDIAISASVFSGGRVRLINRSGATVSAGAGKAAVQGSGVIFNAGTITGNVDLLYPGYLNTGSTYVAAGGTLTGNLRFGSTNDILAVRDGVLGISGTVDGGDGRDTYVQSFSRTATAVLGSVTLPRNFELEGVEAAGSGTVVTVNGPAGGVSRPIGFFGDGTIVNAVDVAASTATTYSLLTRNRVTLAGPLGSEGTSGLAFTNQATLLDGVMGSARAFTNTGTIRTPTLGSAVYLAPAREPFTFNNSGTIHTDNLRDASGNVGQAVLLDNTDLPSGPGTLPAQAASITNSGRIEGNFGVALYASTLDFTNSGTIVSDAERRAATYLLAYDDLGAAPDGTSLRVNNSGSITASGAGAAALIAYPTSLLYDSPEDEPTIPAASVSLTNSGTISATGNGFLYTPARAASPLGYEVSAGAVLAALAGAQNSVTNAAGGTISASGTGAVALLLSGGSSFTVTNAGTIAGGQDTVLNPQQSLFIGGDSIRSIDVLAGAIHATTVASTILNSGTITGSIRLGDMADRIENSGTITGNIFLGAGDDTFLLRGAGRVVGTVDGGAGLDSLVLDSTTGGAVDGSQFVNFERFSQTGAGSVAYSGTFAVDTIRLDGGSITVPAGQTLATQGPVTVTGGAGMETVTNLGTIAGSVDLDGGMDGVDNGGRIGGGVLLGAGDDSYTDRAGSSVGGTVDGGAGSDTYIVALSGDRSGIGARIGFEKLGVTGPGTLSLTLDQAFDAVSLSGSGLDLRLAGFTVGRFDGSDASERLSLDRDVASVALGGGGDRLTIAGSTLAGIYDGGLGSDTLATTATGPVTLSGTLTGFESVALAGGALTVSGTLGAAGGTTGFGDGAQALTVASGGRLLGTVDLGAGADSFRLAAGGVLGGTVSGGAGSDAATLELTADLAIAADALRDFEALTTTGGRTLTLTPGSGRFDRIDAAGGLTVAAGASLSAAQVQFGAGNDRFAIAGGFAGSADGGAGTDALEVSGGSEAAPIAFQTVGGFEAMTVSAGVTTVAGAAQLGRIDMTGGRLIGLAGSSIAAPQIAVGSGATFGSAGAVTGNLAVAGTLSPGASPGTMTVTGNVALASGSTTLLELTPTVSDRLNISGTLAIASGATLTLTGSRPLTPGAALDLIVANGGITGSFATVNQPATVAGFLRQSADRIQLFGQFFATGFNPQVTATINYVNAVLAAGGSASTGLIAAAPSLLTNGNASSPAAFARLNPEPYASAGQIAIENGLTLAKAARSSAAAGGRDQAGAFTFVQGLGGWRSLNGNDARGTSRAEVDNYGVLGGIGFGTAVASVAGFVGYLDSHQRIPALYARTEADGIVGGVIGHAAAYGFDLSAMLAYDGGDADTRRALPGGATARARYGLHSWVSDTSLGYTLPLDANWSLKPEAGLTYVSTRRGAAVEAGGGAFSLAVARRRSHATFVDGALTLTGGTAAGARVHPWVSAGVRHQLSGDGSFAAASFAGAATSFSVVGVVRQQTLATAGAGLSAEISPRLSLFGAYRGEFGKDGTGAQINGGLRMRF